MERVTKLIACSKCGLEKPDEDFSRNRTKKNGRESQCKSCVMEYRALNADVIRAQRAGYRAARKDQTRAYNREYYSAHAEQLVEAQRKRYLSDPEKCREIVYASRKATPERYMSYLASARERYWRDREEILARQRVYYAKNPDVFSRKDRERRARERNLVGENPPSIQDVAIMRKRYEENGCTWCGRRSLQMHIDHVIPLAIGGLHDISNLQPLCCDCNRRKGAMTMHEFANTGYAIAMARAGQLERWYD